MRMTWLDWRKVLGQCGLHGIVDRVTGDKLGGRIVRQSHKIFCESLYLCGSFKVENVGSQFHSLRQQGARNRSSSGNASGQNGLKCIGRLFSVGQQFTGRVDHVRGISSPLLSYDHARAADR
jgi:hypothetical protein